MERVSTTNTPKATLSNVFLTKATSPCVSKINMFVNNMVE